MCRIFDTLDVLRQIHGGQAPETSEEQSDPDLILQQAGGCAKA